MTPPPAGGVPGLGGGLPPGQAKKLGGGPAFDAGQNAQGDQGNGPGVAADPNAQVDQALLSNEEEDPNNPNPSDPNATGQNKPSDPNNPAPTQAQTQAEKAAQDQAKAQTQARASQVEADAQALRNAQGQDVAGAKSRLQTDQQALGSTRGEVDSQLAQHADSQDVQNTRWLLDAKMQTDASQLKDTQKHVEQKATQTQQGPAGGNEARPQDGGKPQGNGHAPEEPPEFQQGPKAPEKLTLPAKPASPAPPPAAPQAPPDKAEPQVPGRPADLPPGQARKEAAAAAPAPAPAQNVATEEHVPPGQEKKAAAETPASDAQGTVHQALQEAEKTLVPTPRAEDKQAPAEARPASTAQEPKAQAPAVAVPVPAEGEKLPPGQEKKLAAQGEEGPAAKAAPGQERQVAAPAPAEPQTVARQGMLDAEKAASHPAEEPAPHAAEEPPAHAAPAPPSDALPPGQARKAAQAEDGQGDHLPPGQEKKVAAATQTESQVAARQAMLDAEKAASHPTEETPPESAPPGQARKAEDGQGEHLPPGQEKKVAAATQTESQAVARQAMLDAEKAASHPPEETAQPPGQARKAEEGPGEHLPPGQEKKVAATVQAETQTAARQAMADAEKAASHPDTEARGTPAQAEQAPGEHLPPGQEKKVAAAVRAETQTASRQPMPEEEPLPRTPAEAPARTRETTVPSQPGARALPQEVEQPRDPEKPSPLLRQAMEDPSVPHDAPATRAFQALQEHDPAAQSFARSEPPPGSEKEPGTWFKSENGAYLQLVPHENEATTESYKVVKPQQGEQPQHTEERHFSQDGHLTAAREQTTSPGRSTTVTQKPAADGSWTRTERHVQEHVDPHNTPPDTHSFEGPRKFAAMLAPGENVTWTKLAQEKTAPPPEAPPPPPQESLPHQAPVRQAQAAGQAAGSHAAPPAAEEAPPPAEAQMPAAARPLAPPVPQGAEQVPVMLARSAQAAAVLENLAGMAEGEEEVELAQDGVVHLLQAAGGMAMELILPQVGAGHLTMRNRQGQPTYYEEVEEELDQTGQVVTRRRTTWDKTARTRGQRVGRFVGGLLQRMEDERAWYATPQEAETGVGTPVKQASRQVRLLPGDIQETVEDRSTPEGSRRTVTRMQGETPVWVENRTTRLAAGGSMETATRQDLKRGLVGEETIIRRGGAMTRTARWAAGHHTTLDYQVEAGPQARTMAWARPAAAVQGRVVTVFQDGRGAAARLVQREARSSTTAADMVGPEAGALLAGRPGDPACLSVEPTEHAATRWELATRVEGEPAPVWMLQEDCTTCETRGQVQGPDSQPLGFRDRVEIRRAPGFGGELSRQVAISSELRTPAGIRQGWHAAWYADDRLQATARSRARRMDRAALSRMLDSSVADALLGQVLPGDGPLVAETTVARNVAQGESHMLERYTSEARPQVAVGRMPRTAGPTPWWIEAPTADGASFQALLSGTSSQAWVVQTPDGLRMGLEAAGGAAGVDQAWGRGDLGALSGLLGSRKLPAWDELPQTDALDERLSGRQDLALLVRKLDGTRDGKPVNGFRVVVRTPEGDLYVALGGTNLPRPFAYVRTREGQERFSIPHGQDTLELTADDEGVFGELQQGSASSSLGRLGEAFGGLLHYVRSGRPLERPGSGGGIPAGFAEALSGLSAGIQAVDRFPGPDIETARALWWDLASLAWGGSAEPGELLAGVAAGLDPYRAVALAGLSLQGGTIEEEGRMAPVRVPLAGAAGATAVS